MRKAFNAIDNYQTSAQFRKRKKFLREFGEPHFSLAEELIKQLDLSGKEKILDIGCGFGEVLMLLKKNGHRGKLVGVDQSNGMINEAKKLASGQSAQFKVALAEKLPFPDGVFDIVICKHALYHFDIPKAIEEMRRVLKPHGRLALTLNSLARGSKKHVEYYKKFLAKKLRCDYPNTTSHANFENYHNFIDGFRVLKEIVMCRYAKLTKKEPFIEYMASFREVFSPAPSDENWSRAIKALGEDMDKEIRVKNSIEERLFAGISILEKIK